MDIFKTLILAVAGGCYMLTGGLPAMALDPRPDLVIVGSDFPEKCPKDATCYVQKVKVKIENSGIMDAGKSAVEVWVSDDFTLDPSDTLLKRVPLGKIKSNTTRSRTLGGKMFHQVKPNFSKTIILVLDPDNVVDERSEANTYTFN